MNTARISRISSLLIVLATFSDSARAKLITTFEVSRASWAASEIVVVETTQTDGVFEVVESWKGNLVVGTAVVIPELIPPVNALPISAYPQWTLQNQNSIAQQLPKQPVRSRIVLFLNKNEHPSPEHGTKKSEWSGWDTGNDPDSIRSAAVWIEGDRIYSFQQPGFTSLPLVLSVGARSSRHDAQSEEELKRDVEEVLRVQKDEEAVITVPNGQQRALRLKPYVTSEILPGRIFALDALGNAGPEAVTVIGEMLDDPKYCEQASRLVEAMVKAGGKTVGAELDRRLRKELAFWASVGPTLSHNWWNEDPTPSSPLRNRYSQTYSLVNGLTQVGYQDPGTAIQLRDLWRTLPQLSSIGGDQMGRACDKFIDHLQNN